MIPVLVLGRGGIRKCTLCLWMVLEQSGGYTMYSSPPSRQIQERNLEHLHECARWYRAGRSSLTFQGNVPRNTMTTRWCPNSTLVLCEGNTPKPLVPQQCLSTVSLGLVLAKKRENKSSAVAKAVARQSGQTRAAHCAHTQCFGQGCSAR